MSEQHYSEKELKAMADQLLAEDAKKQAEEKKKGKQLDEKGIAALPAAQLINAHEKLKELFVKGAKKGKLDASELSDVLDAMDLDSEQMDHIYDSLEQLGIEVGTEDFLANMPGRRRARPRGDQRDRGGGGARRPEHARRQL